MGSRLWHRRGRRRGAGHPASAVPVALRAVRPARGLAAAAALLVLLAAAAAAAAEVVAATAPRRPAAAAAAAEFLSQGCRRKRWPTGSP